MRTRRWSSGRRCRIADPVRRVAMLRRLKPIITGLVRSGAASLFRRMPPRFKGRNRLVRLLHSGLRTSGNGPIVTARMKLGYQMVVDLRSGTEFLSYYSGNYDTSEIRSMLRLFQPGWTAIDVGANIGFWTVPLGQRLAELGGHLYSFEPVSSNCARLRTNIDLNGLNAVVTLIEVGLSDRRGVAQVTLREDFAAGAETGNAAIVYPCELGDTEFRREEIKLDTLDSIADGRGIRRIDFVKVDIEGFEDLFFQGGSSVIRRDRPLIFTEHNQACLARRGFDVSATIESMFMELEYVFLARDEDLVWRQVPRFGSQRLLDDVMLVAKDRVEWVLSTLNAR